jgi:hypothetical protein
VIDHNERRFNTESISDKYRVLHFLGSWMRALAPAELSAAIQDLCKRYSVDLARVTREAVMNWEDVAQREIAMGLPCSRARSVVMRRISRFRSGIRPVFRLHT